MHRLRRETRVVTHVAATSYDHLSMDWTHRHRPTPGIHQWVDHSRWWSNNRNETPTYVWMWRMAGIGQRGDRSVGNRYRPMRETPTDPSPPAAHDWFRGPPDVDGRADEMGQRPWRSIPSISVLLPSGQLPTIDSAGRQMSMDERDWLNRQCRSMGKVHWPIKSPLHLRALVSQNLCLLAQK